MKTQMTKLVLALLVSGLVILVAVGAALAKGTLTVRPDPVVLGSPFTVDAGCGYAVPGSISFEVSGPRRSNIHYFTAGEPVDAEGCFSDEWLAWWGVAGDYQITSWFRDDKGSTHKVTVVKFSAVEPTP
jgi:hypothetical protein